ncbi:MAG: amidohydrolase [Chloroflexi bacterium]|nr:amidohydrolase [Chloroflexota bacterium]
MRGGLAKQARRSGVGATGKTALVGGLVVTMNPQREIFAEGVVVISGERIVAVGAADLLSEHPGAEQVDCAGMMVIPGMINAHTHAPMSLMRGLADDLRLDVWLNGYMLPVEREFVNEEFCRWGTLLSCLEMIRSGVTCFCDMYYHEGAVAGAAAQAGMRAVCGETLMKYPTPDAETYDLSLAYAREFLAQWKGHPLIVPAVAPHAPYTCTPEIMAQAVALAREYGVPLLTHLSETAQEVETAHQEWGMSPIAWAHQQGLFDSTTVAAHCVHVSDADLDPLAAHNVGVAHNPTSNLKLASGFAPVEKMVQRQIAVGIGTDGSASNNDQDLFEEMRLTALLAKGVTSDPTAVPAHKALAMATCDAARALGLEQEIGSLESGKRADIAVVDLNRPHLTPRFHLSSSNTYSTLVYAAKASDVRHVLVDGRWLMRDWQVLTLNAQEIQRAAQAIAEEVDRFLTKREKSLLDKLLAIGGLERTETFEIQVKVPVPDRSIIEAILRVEPAFQVIKQTHREQFDTYFLFEDPMLGRIRYREDNIISTEAEDDLIWGGALHVEPIYTLTLMGPAVEHEYENSVILSRSRFTCRAPHSLRFYREFFAPDREREVAKRRRRYRVLFRGVEYAINLDRLLKPESGEIFLEVKSRTWSQADALKKAEMITDLLTALRVKPERAMRQEYVNFWGEAPAGSQIAAQDRP